MIDKQFVINLAKAKKREDGRNMDEHRAALVMHNPLPKPEGCALVKLGETMVMAGVKMGTGTPFPDSPDAGILIVSAELSPIANPNFESGPPREEAIELSRVIDRGIRESKAIDLEALCITPKEKVWTVFVDIQILNDDGNLFSACALAAMTALQNAKIPTLEDDGTINYEKKVKKLPVKNKPVAVNFAKVQGSIFLDPTANEQQVMEAGIIITTGEDDNICAMQMVGTSGFTVQELHQMFDAAKKIAKDLRQAAQKNTKIMEF